MSVHGYQSYRASGVAWIGDIPDQWDVVLGRRIFKQTRTPAAPDDEQLSSTQKYGVIPQSLFMSLEGQKVVLAMSGTDAFKHVDVDDFVISLRSFQGGIERCRYSGCVSPAYTALKPDRDMAAGYWEYLLKSKPYIAALQSITDGIREGKTIRYEQFGWLPLPVPPVREQRTIAAFLDRETVKIDALVEGQRRLIELLKEKRQAAISHAVTKGLDPTAPMSDSGVEWLGEVPAHWEVKPLKHLVHLKSGGTPSKDRLDYWSGDIPWASAKDLKSDELVTTQDFLTQAAVDEGAASISPAGSVFVLVRGMMLARTFPVCQAMVPMAINQDLKAITGRNGTSNAFIAWLLRGTAAETLNRLDEAGHGTKALRMEAWLSMPVPLPPAEEQKAIVEAVKSSTGGIDALIEEAVVGIRLLGERRAALISAAVTGKIDVRGLVPEQAEAA